MLNRARVRAPVPAIFPRLSVTRFSREIYNVLAGSRFKVPTIPSPVPALSGVIPGSNPS